MAPIEPVPVSRRPGRARARSRGPSGRRGPGDAIGAERVPADLLLRSITAATAPRATGRSGRRDDRTGPTTAVAFPNQNTSLASKTRTFGGCSTGTSSVTSASRYSACSRAPPPPRKKACSVCAARWSTRSPSTRPTQPRSIGLSFGWNMHSRTERLFNL
jgi:hypothetical protein